MEDSKHFSQFIYIVYILFISYKMHLVELPTVKRFIVVEVCIPAAVPPRTRPDFLRSGITFPNKTRQQSVSGAIWTGAGGLTLSRSRRPFRTAYVCFIQALVQPALDWYACAARINQCFVSFARSVRSMRITMLRAGCLPVVNIRPADRTGRLSMSNRAE